MKMSDMIADFIGEMLQSGGQVVAELKRRQVADKFFMCAKSGKLCYRNSFHSKRTVI